MKGRSGRKSWDKERDLQRLWNMSVPILITVLSGKKVTRSYQRRADIALELVKKMTPTLAAIQGTGFGETRIVIVRDAPKPLSADNGNQIATLSGPISIQRS